MCLLHLYKTYPAALLTAISLRFLFLVGANVEKDRDDVGECAEMYLHNYAGDALGRDMPSVRVIGVSSLSSRHQTDPGSSHVVVLVYLSCRFWMPFLPTG